MSHCLSSRFKDQDSLQVEDNRVMRWTQLVGDKSPIAVWPTNIWKTIIIKHRDKRIC